MDKKTLVKLLYDFGIPDPEYWADQELNDDIWAYLAAFRFLRPLQNDLDGYLERPEEWINFELNRRHSEIGHIIKSILEAGIPHKDIGLFAYWIARYAYIGVLHRLSDPAGGDYDLENEGEELPRWSLIETYIRKDGNAVREIKTGRYIPELHTLFPYRNPEGKPKT